MDNPDTKVTFWASGLGKTQEYQVIFSVRTKAVYGFSRFLLNT